MKVAGVSDRAIEETTGKGWQAWLDLLDQQGADELTHTQIAKMLRDDFEVGPWWAQKITGGYEQERKGREVHQMSNGFEIGRTRTWPFPADRILNAWLDEGLRRQWLPEQVADVRETTEGRSIWMEWPDGSSRVNVRLTEKGEAKTSISVEHSQIPDANLAEELKTLWKDRLSALRKLLAHQA